MPCQVYMAVDWCCVSSPYGFQAPVAIAFVFQALVAFKPHYLFFGSSPSCCQAPVAFKIMFLKHELLSQSFFQVSLRSQISKWNMPFVGTIVAAIYQVQTCGVHSFERLALQ